MSKRAPLAVEMPASERDNPGWVKVGIIAAVGFVVGVAWPRVLGVQLGPAAPGSSASGASAASASAEVGRAPDPPPAAAAVAIAPPAVAAVSAPVARAAAIPAASKVSMKRGTVLSCKTAAGETKRGKDCGALQALDGAVLPRLRELATCSGVSGQSGKLSVVVTADFDAARVSHTLGKSTSLPSVEPLETCLAAALAGLSTSGMAHTHARYTVAYIGSVDAAAAPGDVATSAQKGALAEEGPLRSRAAKGAPEEPAATAAAALASGEAQIAWDVALVREVPKTGAVVGRLPRGTRVKLGTARDGWYLVKFGDGFGREGWLYRGAIGR